MKSLTPFFSTSLKCIWSGGAPVVPPTTRIGTRYLCTGSLYSSWQIASTVFTCRNYGTRQTQRVSSVNRAKQTQTPEIPKVLKSIFDAEVLQELRHTLFLPKSTKVPGSAMRNPRCRRQSWSRKRNQDDLLRLSKQRHKTVNPHDNAGLINININKQGRPVNQASHQQHSNWIRRVNTAQNFYARENATLLLLKSKPGSRSFTTCFNVMSRSLSVFQKEPQPFVYPIKQSNIIQMGKLPAIVRQALAFYGGPVMSATLSLACRKAKKLKQLQNGQTKKNRQALPVNQSVHQPVQLPQEVLKESSVNIQNSLTKDSEFSGSVLNPFVAPTLEKSNICVLSEPYKSFSRTAVKCDSLKFLDISQLDKRTSPHSTPAVIKNPLNSKAPLDPHHLTLGSLMDHLGLPAYHRIRSLAGFLLPEDVIVTEHTRLKLEEAEFLCEELNLLDALNVGTELTPATSSLARQPVVIVMGHVDHGKTTLLDQLRNSDVATAEVGGITQTVSAYDVKISAKQTPMQQFTFIDTPGHQAFQVMRSRGAQIADIALLVVAADAGVQPQTKEAYQVIRSARLPTLVVVNKSDRVESSRLSKVIGGIEDALKLDCEDIIAVSARTGENIDSLKESLLKAATHMKLTVKTGTTLPTAYVLEGHRTSQYGSVFYTCISKYEAQFVVGSPVVVSRRSGKLTRILLSDATNESRRIEQRNYTIKAGQSFIAVVDHGKRQTTTDSTGIAYHGDYLMQLSSTRELRQMERYYTQLSTQEPFGEMDSDLLNSDIDADPEANTAAAYSQRSNQDEVLEELVRSVICEELDTEAVNNPDGAIVSTNTLRTIEADKRRAMYRQQCLKLPIYLAAQDDGGLCALRNWITEYTLEKELSFWSSVYPNWTVEQRANPSWERQSAYDAIPSPNPIHIVGTATGAVSPQTLDVLRRTGVPLFCFYPSKEGAQWAEKLAGTAPLRCSSTIYETMQDIQTLVDYYFNPRALREESCVSDAVRDTCVITLEGRRIVGEVKLNSGKFHPTNVTLDVWRKATAEGTTVDRTSAESISMPSLQGTGRLKGFKLLASKQTLRSIRVNGKSATLQKSVSAPCVLQFTLQSDFQLSKGDLVKWYTDISGPALPWENSVDAFSKIKLVTA